MEVYGFREAQVAEFLENFAGICEKKFDFPLVEVRNQAPGQRPGAPKFKNFEWKSMILSKMVEF